MKAGKRVTLVPFEDPGTVVKVRLDTRGQRIFDLRLDRKPAAERYIARRGEIRSGAPFDHIYTDVGGEG
jgi:hypothetical protein